MRAVNLLPRDEPTRSFEAKRGVVFAGGGGAALVTVAFTMILLSAGGAISQNTQARDGLNAELLTIPKPAAQQNDTGADAALLAEKTKRIGALSSALGTRIAWDGVLRQISQVLPEDVWLTSLTTTSADPSAAVPTTGASIVLNGSTYSQDGVARFLSRIAVLPALTNVQLQTSARDEAGPAAIVQFTVLATVKTPGASS